jgi:hypothetical protein
MDLGMFQGHRVNSFTLVQRNLSLNQNLLTFMCNVCVYVCTFRGYYNRISAH